MRVAKNKYGVPVTRKTKIPCRCNKCGTRKTLAKYPEEYRNGEKKCVLGYCSGLMRVDKYRLQAAYDPEKLKKDSGEMCRCNGHPRMHSKGKVNFERGFCCIHCSDENYQKFSEMMNDEQENYG